MSGCWRWRRGVRRGLRIRPASVRVHCAHDYWPHNPGWAPLHPTLRSACDVELLENACLRAQAIVSLTINMCSPGKSEGSRTDDDRTDSGTAMFDARRTGSARLAMRDRREGIRHTMPNQSPTDSLAGPLPV